MGRKCGGKDEEKCTKESRNTESSWYKMKGRGGLQQ